MNFSFNSIEFNHRFNFFESSWRYTKNFFFFKFLKQMNKMQDYWWQQIGAGIMVVIVKYFIKMWFLLWIEKTRIFFRLQMKCRIDHNAYHIYFTGKNSINHWLQLNVSTNFKNSHHIETVITVLFTFYKLISKIWLLSYPKCILSLNLRRYWRDIW